MRRNGDLWRDAKVGNNVRLLRASRLPSRTDFPADPPPHLAKLWIRSWSEEPNPRHAPRSWRANPHSLLTHYVMEPYLWPYILRLEQPQDHNPRLPRVVGNEEGIRLWRDLCGYWSTYVWAGLHTREVRLFGPEPYADDEWALVAWNDERDNYGHGPATLTLGNMKAGFIFQSHAQAEAAMLDRQTGFRRVLMKLGRDLEQGVELFASLNDWTDMGGGFWRRRAPAVRPEER